jgi:hypothetical protein
VRQRNASICHHDHQVPQTQFETRVPANTQDDDLSVEMSSLEKCFDRTGRLHSVIIPDRGLFAAEFSFASSGVKNRLPLNSAGRSSGVAVAEFQMPAKSWMPDWSLPRRLRANLPDKRNRRHGQE